MARFGYTSVYNQRPSPFFVYRRMRFLILGRSVGLKKKNLKKSHEHSRNRRPGTDSMYYVMDIVS